MALAAVVNPVPMPMPVPALMNLYRIGDSDFALMNLKDTKGTNVKEFEAKKGSETMMDFSHGDPLANSKIGDMHMKAGASIDFNGASGKQEMGVMNKFDKGASTRLNAAVKSKDMSKAGTAMDDKWATQDIKNKALDHAEKDAFKVVLLI